MGWSIVTTIGTLAPFLVAAGTWRTGTCSRSNGESAAPALDAALAGGTQSPMAAEAKPRKSRLDSLGGRDAARRSNATAVLQCLPGSSFASRFDQ
jgi:hypothetical protein